MRPVHGGVFAPWPLLLGITLVACEPRGPGEWRAERDPAATLTRAGELEARHRLAEAHELLERHFRGVPLSAPAIDPLEAELRARQARLLVDLSRPREALAILDALGAGGRGTTSLGDLRARALLDSGRAAEARAILEALPANPDRLEQLSRALLAECQPGESGAAAAAALVLDPWREPACLLLGRALVRAGQREAGEVLLRHYEEGGALRRTEQEALADEAAGKPAHALHRRALLEKERGRLHEALLLENRAIAADAGFGEGYLELARLSIELARPEEAAKVLAQLPENAAVAALRAEAEEALTRGGAYGLAREASRGKPLSRCAGEILSLAKMHETAGHVDRARAFVIFALRLDPRSREAREEVVRLYSEPRDLFVRLWAQRHGDGASFEATARELLPRVGLGAEATLARLQAATGGK